MYWLIRPKAHRYCLCRRAGEGGVCKVIYGRSTHHGDSDLGLEEIDVFGEVESVLATVSNHVCVEDIICSLEDSGKMLLVWNSLKWKLEDSDQQVDYLKQKNAIYYISNESSHA